MADHASDATLVAAYLGGDRSALGDIYDRYAAALLDTATAMLRNPDDAADVVQDVFVAAAAKLDRLREPDRLKPWLFAIARHEVYRRTRHRSRIRPTDFAAQGGVDVTAPTDPLAEGAQVVAVELAAQVRAAASGLDPRDQLVLELTARQGLAGRDLADALGVTEAQCAVLVHRMRERVRRSLGAFTVARMGRRDCPSLAGLLEGWDGTFSVLVRKRVARHVDACTVCAQTGRRFAAAPLIGLVPVLAAPTELRARVLSAALGPEIGTGDDPDPSVDAGDDPDPSVGTGDDPDPSVGTGDEPDPSSNAQHDPGSNTAAGGEGEAASVARLGADSAAGAVSAAPARARTVSRAAGYHFDAHHGFPERQSRRRPALLAAAAALLAIVSVGGWWAAGPGRERGLVAGLPTTTSLAAPPSTDAPGLVRPPAGSAATSSGMTSLDDPTSTGPSTDGVAPPTPTAPPGSASPKPTTRAPGRLTVSTTVVDLGAAAQSVPLTLRNIGGQPVAWRVAETVEPFLVSTPSGALDPGGVVTLRVGVDRSALGEGDIQVQFTVRSSALGGGTVTARAAVERAPTVDVVRAPSLLVCPWTRAQLVTVAVADESGVRSAGLSWSGPGRSGSTGMSEVSPGGWSGVLGVGKVTGIWTWQVTATDARGNSGGATGTTVVRC